MKLRNLLESPASKYLDEDGNIWLSHQSLSVLPQDLPSKVDRHFFCYSNQLTSFQYCPSIIGRDFYCHRNQLKTLRYLPKEIDGDIDLSHNPDCYVELFYLCNVKLDGRLYLDDNQELENLFNEKYKNTGTRGMLKFQNYLEDKYDLT